MRDWLQNLRGLAVAAIVAWAALASAVAAGSIEAARRAHSENADLAEQIARRDRTDFLVELDECAQELLATRSLLTDRLDWMARNHLAELRSFGRQIMLGDEDEPFDFLAVHERRVWEHEAQRMNEDLARRGVAPLRIK